MIAAWKDDVIMFALGQLEKFQPRDDYCELLELAIISAIREFISDTPVHKGQPILGLKLL